MASDVQTPAHSELGKSTEYESLYNPNKLFPVLRNQKRSELGITTAALPFLGYDFWNHYEVSWLNPKGKPVVAMAEVVFNCHSPYLIESKSMKLYFNSLNNTQFSDAEEVAAIVKKDLEERSHSTVTVRIIPLNQVTPEVIQPSFKGVCIDDLDINCSQYTVDSTLLKTEDMVVEETLYSDLLKSNCLVTGQPDWGSVEISYHGKKINHESLLRYIVSFRNHTEFGEHCIERIFMDIMRCCSPLKLRVHGRYTRRGGIEINSERSSHEDIISLRNVRLCRQ